MYYDNGTIREMNHYAGMNLTSSLFSSLYLRPVDDDYTFKCIKEPEKDKTLKFQIRYSGNKDSVEVKIGEKNEEK